MNLVTGADGGANSSLYRDLRLLTDLARNGGPVREGGLESTIFAGPGCSSPNTPLILGVGFSRARISATRPNWACGIGETGRCDDGDGTGIIG
ncbi:hypothetical protein [Nocardia aurantiaca]|uniref:Uncharacterized protein n=1 Tax=Nocardia aurantiaca TaxID=2675850 RepID=A0A6I3L3D6_9NOCA|nr:hypothetical protein [Nocardia aurantiaca]MTE15808.1 hypothetical protein [Nocardia aurantiaca]